jgi:predicted nucleic acid-binding protein
MTKIVVDASVAIKWYVPEIHADAAVRILEGDFVLCAPDLIGAELANAIWKKVRRAEISR